VGSDAVRNVNVRIVASTNRDLLAESRRGKFRTDLFYRLEVVRLRMPPLRQRPEDIPGLVSMLLAGKLPEGDKASGANLRKLVGYGWPGNVRELRNALLRAVTLARSPNAGPSAFASLVFNLGPASALPLTLGAEFPGVASSVPYKEAKEQLLLSFEALYVTALLNRHGGNITKSSTAAGLSRKHLYELMRKIVPSEIVD
jgi:DNA-binding NtrC family response regulator